MIYVIETDSREIKIGITKNIKDRLRAISTGNSIKPKLLGLYFNINDDRKIDRIIEREAHSLLADRRANGEWFSVPVITGQMAVEIAAENLGHELYHSHKEVENYSFQKRDFTKFEFWTSIAPTMVLAFGMNVVLIGSFKDFPQYIPSGAIEFSMKISKYKDYGFYMILASAPFLPFIYWFLIRDSIMQWHNSKEVSRYQDNTMKDYLEWRELMFRSEFKPDKKVIYTDKDLRKTNRKHLHKN